MKIEDMTDAQLLAERDRLLRMLRNVSIAGFVFVGAMLIGLIVLVFSTGLLP